MTAVTPSTATTDGRITLSYSGLTQTTITDPRGQPTTISYGATGLPTQFLSPLGAPPVQYGYTSGLLSNITDRLGRVTTRAYDAGGRLVSHTDPSGRTARYAYSALNQLTAVADPGGGVTHFTYDPNGNLLSVKDAKGNTTSYVYDVLDRVQQRTDPLGKQETFQYDGNNNLIQHTDRKTQGTTFSYDGLNRPVGTTGVGFTVTRTWDAGNRLTQIADSVGGTITNGWDVLDRLTTETTALGIVRYDNPANPADRGYDALGRGLWMEVPGQARVTYSWDPASRLTQLQQGSQVAAFAYDNANRRTLLTLPNGASTEYQYDLASQLTALIYRDPSATELGRLTYGYDATGNRTTVGETFASTQFPAAITETGYNAGNRQTTFGSKAMTYDDNGNLTQITEGADITALTWDSRNRLTAFSAPTTTATFTYDALGRRSAKTIDGTTTQFQYDGLDTVREIVGSTATGYLNGPSIDEPLVRGGSEFFWADALGSVLRLTGATGAVATSYRYEPFGRASTATGSSTNPAQYTGRENDGIGLHYYRARYYHPGLQRFMSEDPIGFLGGDKNLYAYVQNQPTNGTDSLGLWYPRFHAALTKEAAAKCGLSENATNIIAAANVRTDLSVGPFPTLTTLWPPSRRHAGPKTDWDQVVVANFDKAVALGSSLAAWEALGKGLHTVQDVYAHYVPGRTMWDHFIWHTFKIGIDPDDPNASPQNLALYEVAREASIAYIAEFMRARGKTPQCSVGPS